MFINISRRKWVIVGDNLCTNNFEIILKSFQEFKKYILLGINFLPKKFF